MSSRRAIITIDDFEVFCRRSFSRVLAAIDELGDDLVNETPGLIEANSPFVIVTHTVGACEWWVGHVILGEPSNRVRDDEFAASGSVDDLHRIVGDWLASLKQRKSRIAQATELVGSPRTQLPLEGEWTVGAVLLHVYEELAQHLGHLEITADLLTGKR
ncbi:MAG: DUF664 domain-containing protein [Acidimicrobiales bacterium]